MTHNNQENLAMMDAVTAKYGKTRFVTVTKTLAIILVVIFFICLIATGLLVYSFSSGCPKNNEPFHESSAASTSSASSSGSNKECVHLISNTNNAHTQTLEINLETTASALIPTTYSTEKSSIATTSLANKNKINVSSSSSSSSLRLPKNILPQSYQIKLIPFIQEGNFTFHGEETIFINITETTSTIILHAMNLTIDSVKVTNKFNQSYSISRVKTIKENQFLVIEFVEHVFLEVGQQYLIFIKFKGILNNMLEGFYRSSYIENNSTRWIAATQFQPTDARKAFPCFDEPSFKAKFQISIARMKNMSAISNMPLKSTTEDVIDLPNYVWDNFEESLPMSTYLVAFIISDFKNLTKGNFRVWARPSALSQAGFALEVAPVILKYYEKFFNIPYPLPKVDMVAIPDFSAGAMENWGLITYREPLLLFEKDVSNSASKQRIAHVIAHELAHQWFGNLVTPIWWEDLWLNEGFATYVEYLGAHAANPKWKDLDIFIVHELQEALGLDSLKTSHPISVNVQNPEEVNDIFDRISYSKGASIIRMMKEFLGDKFHTGLHKYLINRKYSNAEQNDLWESLTEQAVEKNLLPKNVTVKDIMDTWTLQIGYPVVNARIADNNKTLIITQERYFLNSELKDAENTLWWIHITFLDNSEKKRSFWFKNEKEIQISDDDLIDPETTTWFLLNVNQTGYFRVNYDAKNWNLLINRLLGNGHIMIPTRNRAQLLDDALNLAFSGHLSYDIALNVTLYLTHEREYVAWKAALNNFHFLHAMFRRTGYYDKYRDYMVSLIKDFYYELTFEEQSNDEYTKILNRMEILDYACNLAIKDCVLRAVQLFQNWKNSANPDKDNRINPNLRQTVYCTAIADNGQEEWDFIWQRYLNTNVASDKEILLNSLACSKDYWILNRYLEWSITENSGIRKHDTARVFAMISKNPVGQDLVYRFLKTNWQRIREYLGPTSMSLSTLVRAATEHFNTKEDVDDFKLFYEKNCDNFGIASRTANQAIEQAEANTRWMKKNFHVVKKWFENAKVW